MPAWVPGAGIERHFFGLRLVSAGFRLETMAVQNPAPVADVPSITGVIVDDRLREIGSEPRTLHQVG